MSGGEYFRDWFSLRSLLMKRFFLPVVGVVLAGLLHGCHTITRNHGPAFVPPVAYVPVLAGPGAEAAALVGAGGAEAQVAVAPARNVLFTAQGQLFRADKRRDHSRAGEVGFGIVAHRTRLTHWGILAGLGAGRGAAYGNRYETWSGWLSSGGYDSADWHIRASYETVYLQPFLALTWPDEEFELALAAKLTGVRFRHLAYDETRRRGVRDRYDSSATTTTTSSVVQHNVWRRHLQCTGQFAVKVAPQLWVQFSAGLTADLRRYQRIFAYNPAVAAVGVRYRIGPSVTRR